jgi:hypothetical protein
VRAARHRPQTAALKPNVALFCQQLGAGMGLSPGLLALRVARPDTIRPRSEDGRSSASGTARGDGSSSTEVWAGRGAAMASDADVDGNLVVCLLSELLTKGERSLAEGNPSAWRTMFAPSAAGNWLVWLVPQKRPVSGSRERFRRAITVRRARRGRPSPPSRWTSACDRT